MTTTFRGGEGKFWVHERHKLLILLFYYYFFIDVLIIFTANQIYMQ
jgi:hypothetical protein